MVCTCVCIYVHHKHNINEQINKYNQIYIHGILSKAAMDDGTVEAQLSTFPPPLALQRRPALVSEVGQYLGVREPYTPKP